MKFNFLCGSLMLLIAGSAAWGADPAAEIIGVLQQHYVDRDALNAQQLNAASVAGILKMLGAGAQLLTAAEAESNRAPVVVGSPRAAEPLARVEVIQPDIGYIRVSDMVSETPLALDSELEKFAQAKVTGYVLDLRFADGTNFSAAAAVASRFLPAGVEVFTVKRSDGEPQAYRTSPGPLPGAAELAKMPLLLLVNAQTRGSAEVLVGALRTQDRGIIIGGPTAGLPVAWRDVSLSDGQVLRLATAKVTFPKGGELFPNGLIPDILVKMDSKTERAVVFNVASNVTLTASLQPQLNKHHLTEATLVKVFRGESIETPAPIWRTNGIESPVLGLTNSTTNLTVALTLDGTPAVEPPVSTTAPARDVVLQRAVDILKGIRVLLSWQ